MDGKYFLIIENNVDDIDLMQVAFKKFGILNKLTVVNDGQEALDYLWGKGKYAERDTSQLPAMIILDLKLPSIDGLKVLKQIRLNIKTSRIPIAVLISSINKQDIEECEKLGINRYYRKPENSEQFFRILQEIRSLWPD